MRALLPPLLLLAAPALAQDEPPARPVPYWASITAGEARMRTGPGRQFPAIWLYRRAGLPVKVVQVAKGWRRVRDQDGADGWMLVNLLSDRRTAVVTGEVTPLRASPDAAARVLWQAEPGVVGRISACREGWCRFEVGRRAGYVAVARLWGVGPTEVVE